MDIIDHIAIKVSDLEVAMEWYMDHMKAEVAFRDHKYIRLKVGNTSIALIDEKHYPHAHFGIRVDHQDQLPSIGERVEHRDGTIGVYVEDPFGNYLEYIWYSPEQCEVFLK